MDKEEKSLLLQDLSSRLPYELWVDYEGNKYLVTGYAHGMFSLTPSTVSSITGPCPAFTELKPYLRPMSSMTDEETETLWNIWENDAASEAASKMTDFLNKKHLDHHHLTDKGLALEAPDGMYN